MATTQIKNGFNGGSDAQLLVNPDGSINVNSGSSGGTTNSNIEGLNSFQTSQYIVGTTPVQITPTPLASRSSMSMRIEASAGVPVYLGNSSAVSPTNGYPMYDGDTLAMDLTPTDTIYFVSTAPGQVVAVVELA